MKVKSKHMLKTLVYQVDLPQTTIRWVVAVVRGDHDVNEGKLNTAVGAPLRLADETAARAAGFKIGYVGPHAGLGRKDVLIVADIDTAQAQFWAAGANEQDHHVKHFNWHRDCFEANLEILSERLEKKLEQGVAPDGQRRFIRVADIRNAVEGDPSPKADGGILKSTKGIEIGHVFKLGDKYTKAMNVSVLDPANNRLPILMGCYGIGVNRILAAAIERQGDNFRGYDENGIIWPAALAPFHVHLIPVSSKDELQMTLAEKLRLQLEEAGAEVLLDDRDERPGVKFKDADLIGIPVRIVIGRDASDGKVEFLWRSSVAKETITAEEAAARVLEMIRTLSG
jgi:prolyl-tRNA synthetase